MPISVNWANAEKTIILFKIVEKFTSEEYLQGIEERKALQDTISHKSSVIADFTDCIGLPADALGHYPRAHKIMPHPNFTGILVITGARGIIRRMARIFSNTFGKLHFADTLEEAYEIIKRRTATDA